MYQAYVKLKAGVKKFIPRPVFRMMVDRFHLLEAIVANIRYGFPARKMKFIGVTGTNGKTTTTLMVATILEEAGYKVGMSSSAFIKDGGPLRLNDLPGRLTNPPALVLQKLLRDMRKKGVEWVALECGSHSLQQHRVWGITFESAIITNLTEDHLDYHGTMENYARAKGLLLGKSKVAVINRDSDWADYFLSLATPTNVTYGKDKRSDYRLMKIDLKQKSTDVTLDVRGSETELDLQLVGEFNAYNATAALAATAAAGVDPAVAKRALEKLERVPGRLDAVQAGQKFTVLIDDAHTPDAIANVLKAARATTDGKLYIITGAAGDRGGTRSAPIGKTAASLADVLIVTDDEPHHDDPDEILAAVQEGAKGGPAEVQLEIDRCDAMRAAFKQASPSDVVVIAGMGYKHHRDGPRGQEPWDDYVAAADILQGRQPEFEANWRHVMHEAWPDKR